MHDSILNFTFRYSTFEHRFSFTYIIFHCLSENIEIFQQTSLYDNFWRKKTLCPI
jgi:hypothetical protein